MEEVKTEISLCKIKEGHLAFVAAIFKFGDEWVNENYPEGNAKAFVRNSPDGCYEIFMQITEID